MAGATVRVCTSAATGQPCSPLALIYSDPGLTQALANPTSTDGLGNYTFYAAPGRYEVEISGPSITTKQLPERNSSQRSDRANIHDRHHDQRHLRVFAFAHRQSHGERIGRCYRIAYGRRIARAVHHLRTISGPPRSVSRDPIRGATSRPTCLPAAATNPRLPELTPRERSLPAQRHWPSPTTTISRTAAAFSLPNAGSRVHALHSRARDSAESECDRHGRIDNGALQGRGHRREFRHVGGERSHHGHHSPDYAHADQLRGRVLAGSRGRGRVSRVQRCRRKLRAARIFLRLLWIQRRKLCAGSSTRGRRRIPGPGSTDSGRPRRLAASPIRR